MPIVNALVEGTLDEAVALRIIEATGHTAGICYGKRGSDYIRRKIRSFNQTARSSYYLTLVDFMGTRLSCPPDVVAQWLPGPQPRMLFRVVVRELESWLLADREHLAEFLRVSVDKLPLNPEQVDDPKQLLVNLARHSRSARIRSALTPEPHSTALVGKLYNSELRLFIHESWDVDSARKNSLSLDRCLLRLRALT
jgi:hypothetical protein